jgi:hypothetical protein
MVVGVGAAAGAGVIRGAGITSGTGVGIAAGAGAGGGAMMVASGRAAEPQFPATGAWETIRTGLFGLTCCITYGT